MVLERGCVMSKNQHNAIFCAQCMYIELAPYKPGKRCSNCGSNWVAGLKASTFEDARKMIRPELHHYLKVVA